MSQAQEAADAEEARKCDSDIFTALGRLDVGAVRHILRTVPGAATKKDDIDRTALHCAAWHGRVKVGQLLLAARADVDAKDRYGRTPLHTAACWGKADVVTLLLEAKASVTAKNNLGKTPLDFARHEGHAEVVRLLEGAESWLQEHCAKLSDLRLDFREQGSRPKMEVMNRSIVQLLFQDFLGAVSMGKAAILNVNMLKHNHTLSSRSGINSTIVF
eukprot:s33_g75.t3